MTLTLLSEKNNIPSKKEKEGIDMKGGWYWFRNKPRVWYPWKESKSGKLFFTKYLDGTRIYSPEQAERVLSTIRGQNDAGIFDPANWGKDKTIIFQNAWEVYMKESLCGKIRTEDRERVFNTNLMPYWMGKSLSEIEEHHIKDWFSTLPDHYSPASRKKILNVLRAFLNYFQITRRKVFKYPEVKIPKKAVLWLSQEDQERVFEFIPSWHRPIFEFIKTYGCRSSEACNLKKMDVDWAKRTIIFKGRKNAIENELPITEEIEKYLVGGGDWLSLDRGLRNPVESLAPTPFTKISNLYYIFCTSKGQPYTRQFLYNIWHYANLKAHKKYGVAIVPLKNGTRHSLASRLLEQGETLEVIARILGNSQQVVERNYGRIRTQRVMGILEGGK
jgi:site-specific recombinase XerD